MEAKASVGAIFSSAFGTGDHQAFLGSGPASAIDGGTVTAGGCPVSRKLPR